MDYLEKGLYSSERLDSTIQMSSAAHRAHAGRHRSTGARLTHLSKIEPPRDTRRLPESSPPSPARSSSASGHRASRLSAGAALSRAVFVACCTAVTFLAASASLLALPLQAEAQTTGICGRTPAVRTAILAKISGVSNCADVTDAHLAAITGSLPLGNGITTALATEDFAGLTALTILYLNGTGLTTLPDNVFDDLIALQILSLQDNELTTLPDGVFEPLTALIFGSLSGNPGAPFAPEVDALPDDGTVPIAGGTVTLDGSDGGPWGTNVTYSWRQTSGPASGVTFDDAGSATPVVTIPALAVGTELAFTLTVNGRGNMEGTASDTDIATVAATDTTNTPASGTPAITGTPQVGEVLHVGTSGIIDTDGLTNVSYRYQWLRVNSDGASNETRIGSNADTYTLVNDDEGKRIRVRVRFTDDAANPETLISAATGAVAPFPTSSICGRTAEVRNELLYLIEDNEGTAVACSDVTDDHLAAITGDLTVVSNGITALAAGDFAGLTSLTELHLYDNDLSTLPDVVFEPLTSLTELYLFDNDLSTLPAGVFTGLTSLTILDLADNALSTLPAGVFTGLTSLTELYLDANDLTSLPAGVFTGLTSLTIVDLNGNELTTLPDGVFEPLTSLTELNLTDNTGAPFAPEADALPDDGTVPIAGGMVTLDGNGTDGGPWGTNLTYGWALTNPASGVTVTFDDAASATPVVTIPALAANTELTFTLAVTGRGGTDGIAPATDTAKVTATDANAAPTFTSAAAFDAAENQTAVGTVVASDGDTDDSVTGYAIQGGADASKFSVVEATGVLTFASAPNFEDAADEDADNAYVVVVRATSGTGAREKTADQTITVTVTDVASEAPGVPAAPAVTSASVTSVTVAWAAPANAGPPITDYDYRYRVKTPQGPWAEVTGTTITALSATIAGLAEDTEYDVQVRATNDEGTSNWSESGSGSTDANAAPTITSPPTFDAAENQTAVGTVQASDDNAGDNVTGYAIQGGADASTFSIVPSTGVLTFASAPNFEAPADADTDNGYVVVVRVTSGTGAREKTADQTITVTVTDVDSEVPGVPAVPTVSAASESSVMASWTAPATAGPAITDYDYRYRVKAPQGPWTEVTNTAVTGLSAMIAGLAEDTEYEVQVRATNDEGTSGWSASGSGSTNANNTPATGKPAITGTAQVGQTLTAGLGTIADTDGLPATFPNDYMFQWVRVDADGVSNETPIGANAATYTPVAADVGKKITVKVSFTDAGGAAEGPLTSDAYPSSGTIMLPAGVTVSKSALTVTEEDTTGDSYTVVLDSRPTANVTITIGGQSGTDVTAVPSPMTFTPMNWNTAQTVTVTAGNDTDTADDMVSLTHSATSTDTDYSGITIAGVTVTVTDNTNTPAEGKPTISGPAQVGETLTADPSGIIDADGLTTATFTYQWLRVDADGVSNETNIGTNAATYTLAAADAGKKIKVKVSFTDERAHPEAVTSEAYPSSGSIGDSTIRSLVETYAELTVQHAENIGDPVRASGVAGPVTYRLEGEDADKFMISSSNGQLSTRVGERYDYEEKPSYVVTVNAVNQQGQSVSIPVIINIVDLAERPTQLAAPTVSATAGSITSLDVSWTAPPNVGRPPITHYNLRYREDSVETWTDGPQNVTGTAAQITDLTAATPYQVGVQAVNHEGSVWSGYGVGRTDAPTVSFGASAYTAIEGVQSAAVTVQLDPPASSAVTIPVTTDPQGGATSADYDGVPGSVTFAAGETEQTFTVTATDDSVDDDGESVQLGFGALPSGVLLGSPSTARVALVQDAGVTTWYVWFGESSYTVAEGGSATISVHLNSPWKPERNEALTVPLFDPKHRGGASADDYSGLPESVTFQPGQTRASFTVRVTDDSEDDDGESVLIGFRRLFPDDLEVGRYGPHKTTLHVADNDGETAVTVSFDAANYTAAEGGATATVGVRLNTAPGRAVTIPLTPSHRGATAGDYSGLPGSVTFGASDTVQSFTLTATDDSDDDDRESVAIGFGSLPAKVSAGSPSEAVVQLTDNDHGHTGLQVRFDARAGAVRDGVEEGGSYRLGVRLDTKPGRTLTIPLTYGYLGGATAADFTGLPANVTFGANGTSTGVTIRPVDDFEEDPGESLKVSFGSLPAGVSVSSWSGRSTIIPVIDNDATPGLSVADASAREWPNPLPCLIFVVTMDRMDVDHEVRVDYATRSGTAVAGQDFKPIAGTLVFRPADSKRRTASKSLCVKVLDDAHDEGVEEMTLVLSNPVRASLVDGTATGSISNTDPMPRGFLGRFGRTAAVEIIAQVEERIRARRAPGMSARLAGRELRSGMTDDVSRGFLRQLGSLARSKAPVEEGNNSMAGFPGGAVSLRTTGRTGVTPIASDPQSVATGPNWIGYLKRGFGVGDLLTGSSFELNRDTGHGGMLSFWSRGARSQFTGREDRVTLDGRTATTMAGADYRKGRLVAGLSLAHSRGQGDYKGVGVGALASSVTGLYPWLGYQATERITVWGVTGFGKGSLRLTPGTGGALETGLSMAMAAAGMRGELVAPVMGGFGMAFKTDALWVATSNAGLEGPAGSLAATRAVVTRLRAGLEASRGYDFRSGLSLQPSLEVGLRQDDGNAETGAGVDVAGGLIFSVPSRGIKADLRVRTLLMHQDQDYRERGVLVSFSYDPTPSTPLGMTVRLAPSWGGQARSAAEALWSRETMKGLGGRRQEAGARFDTELAYGLPVGGRLVGIPLIGIRTSTTSRYYQLGYKLAVLQRGAMNFELGVAAQHRESLVRGTVDRGVTGRITMTW